MPVLVLTRALLLVGDSLSLRKVSQFTRIAPFRGNIRFLSDSGSLTLASLGLKNEVKTVSGNEKNKLQQGVSTIEVPKSRVNKRVSGNKTGLVKERNPVDIKTAPFAVESFSELGLPPLLVERLEKEGFTVPTDVQAAAVPTVLKNHDVVIQSYTGSGKTLAYLLPILSQVGPLRGELELLNGNGKGNKVDIEAVIVAPSRELGMQIVREVEKLLGPADKKLVQQLVGGANRSRQEEALRKNKPAIVVGTPGRIAEISAAGKLPTHGCRYLVLDEVDQLLAINFREDMQRILDHVGRRPGARGGESNSPLVKRSARQTIMVSATVPFSVIRAARSWGCDPLLVQANKVVPLESVPPSGPVNNSGTPSTASSSSNIQTMPSVQSLPPNLQHYYTITRIQHKIDMLRRCVHALDAKCVIAFMNHTKQLKDAVFKLEARGMKAAELHGDLSKLVRSTILKKFRNGEVRVLLTNELSARGLDLPECDLVVNLGLPTDSVHYAHRAGRTGRLGRKGTVVTICEEPEVFVVKKLQKQLSLSIQACEFSEGNLVITED
ncbi:DEAD-box ATP-dependent RNA helicase 47, mitochondrial [Nicotiana tomentosiformis]|uniref:DEAD-box ATP-dependent RNA helicase 47, mitochondrial n=1 Tax=Nicotiana tomentosiformis TaxID=4098 RepID=UPI00051CA491|nr:DEAD-box ATP-dependent RNA helicase 47, mitochondrial [Nicotiana tomentosiformis]XP_018627890.1 DEAD-box ATP-dependent RNA helicase 47, mitochondrial [Nicotiana tomentosiformis]